MPLEMERPSVPSTSVMRVVLIIIVPLRASCTLMKISYGKFHSPRARSSWISSRKRGESWA